MSLFVVAGDLSASQGPSGGGGSPSKAFDGILRMQKPVLVDNDVLKLRHFKVCNMNTFPDRNNGLGLKRATIHGEAYGKLYRVYMHECSLYSRV